MRYVWAFLALAIAGCGGASLSIGTPPVSGGGGGGPAVAPSPEPVCPVDFVQALEREVAAVPDRLVRESLQRDLRWAEDLANAGSLSARERVIEGFLAETEALELRGLLAPAHAARMRDLMRCYRWP